MKGYRYIMLLLVMSQCATVSDGCGRGGRKKRRPPANRSPSISCPSVGDVTTSRLTTSRIVSWGSPSVSDDHGGWNLRQISGRHSGSSFSEGSHAVTYKVTDNGGLSSTCSFSFRVTVIRCSGHSRPRNGFIECGRSDNIYGTKCKFSCEAGYWLDGSSTSTCQRNGANSYRTPVCKKKQCGEREMPPKSAGVYCTDGRYYGSMCSLRCDTAKGYTPRYLNFAKCLANTRWQYQNWACDDTEKPKILNCPEGELKTSNNTYVWPSLRASDNSGTVTLTQSRGQSPGTKLLEELQIIEYQAVDPSGNKAPPCVFSVTYEVPACAAPVYSGHDDDPHFTCSNYKVGSSCVANCTSKVLGSKYIQCQKSGGVIPTSTWVGFKGPYPTCYKKQCADLKAPINGALVCDKFYGGETCQIHCNVNYDIPQSMKHLTILICGGNGWSPREAPDCTEMAFPDVYNLPSELYYYGGDCEDIETNENIRDRFLENLIIAAVDECKDELCSIENVEVTCGPIEEDDEEGDYYYYDDDPEDPGEDFDFEIDEKQEDTSNYNDYPEFLNRRRRAVTERDEKILPTEDYKSTTEVALPALTWTQSTEGSEEADDLNGSGQGSGEVKKRRKKKPQSRTVLIFNMVVRNTSSIMTTGKVVDLLDRVLNSTSVVLNGTRKVRFRTGSHGNLTFNCGPGKVLSNTSQSLCVGCPRGQFHNEDLDTCMSCPAGTFSDNSGQTVCKPCDRYFGTENNGSTTSKDCKPMCPPGKYSLTGLLPCTPCPLGTIQPEHFGKQCISCPSDSTTIQMGSNSQEKCVPFDVMIKGPVLLNLGPVITEWVEDVTMSFWIRTLPPKLSHVNISFTLSHPTRGHQMTLDLTHETGIRMRRDQVPVHTFIPQDLWTHIGVVWKGYPRFIDIYRGGKRVEHYDGFIPNCFLPEGTELTVDVGEASSATLREIYIIPESNTSHIIADMAGSCTPVSRGYKSLITKIVPSDPSKLSMVVPSVCSEIDRCSPNPCPDHYCRSFKYGFDCTCKGGYSGPTCSISPDYCVVDNKCQNDALCENMEDGVNCTCTEDYKGQYCETPIVNGNWAPWSAWSECSLTCGGGETLRSRECNNPAPEPEHGKPCEGAALEETVCNMEDCPECKTSQLTLGRGINAECIDMTTGSMNCSVTCDAGLVFPQDEPSYVCRDEVWVPEDKTISCVEVSIPDKVEFLYTIPYKTSITNREQDLMVIKNQVSVCASNASCVMEETCWFTVSMETCVREEGGCPNFPEGYKASIRFTVDVVASNWSAEVSKTNLREAWKTLNDTYSELEDMYDDCFVVLLRSGSVKPGTAIADSDLTCPQGFVPDLGYCSACAPGTREENGTCILCDRGWYQEESGQLTCNMCPAAFNTLYMGSGSRSDCQPPPANAFMLLTDPVTGTIWTVNMVRFTPEAVSLPDSVRTSASAYDPVTRHIFFADKGTPAIHSIGPRTSETYVKLNWAASVDGIAVDPVSRLIFYTDKGNDVIGVVTMVTKYHKIIIRSGTYMPRHITVDPSHGVLYWIDWGIDQKIERANYDGTERQTLVGSTSIWPEGLALDLGARRMYWSDGGKKTVEVMDLDGNNKTTLLTSVTNFPSSITLFQDYIFYSAITPNNSVIMRVNKDGSGLGTTELPPFRYISCMHSYRNSTNKSKTVSNGCSKNNGGCPFMCFPRPTGNRICACPDGYVMNENENDCKKEIANLKWWDVWMKPRRRRSTKTRLLSRRHHQ